jgi:2,4-dienoyl-CoA reductase-like NADH-dependent reductase (Old Yellow Enzyme family)
MPDLFAPVTIGAVHARNAIAMAPLTRQRADADGVPKPFVADYYAARAIAGLIIAEGTQPSFQGQGYCRTPGIHTVDQIDSWRRVTDAVHAQGGAIFLQIMHAGRIFHPLNRRIEGPGVAPSAIAAKGQMWTDEQGMRDFPTPRALETAEIAALVDEFVTAARNARTAGFDGVEVHAANGYLVNQFLATGTNQRTDGYGGTLAGRIRFPVEVTQAIAAAIGADRTGIRISPGHMFNDLVDENPLETHRALLDALDTAALAYVHLMLPDAFDPGLNNAGDTQALLQAIRAATKGSLLAAGGYTRERAQAALDDGTLQMVAFGRPFIANPDLVQRMRHGIPLAEANPDLFYTPGPEGYSDYPAAA